MGRRKSVILNGILLTAASVSQSQASPVTRRNSGDLEDLEEISEDAKLRRRPVFARKARNGWAPVDLQDEQDYAARALSLTMVGLLARIRVLFAEKGGKSRIPGGEGKAMSIEGGNAGTDLGEEEQRLLVAIIKKVVGTGQEEQIEGWVKSGFSRMEKYAALHQKINKNLLNLYVANKYGKKQDLANIGNGKLGWEQGQTETYGEAENIRKIFELFRYKKQEKIENKNALVIGFSLKVGLQEDGIRASELVKSNEVPNITRTLAEVNMIDFRIKKETTGIMDMINNA